MSGVPLIIAVNTPADFFNQLRLDEISQYGKFLNSSISALERDNPQSMRGVFAQIDYCHPRLGEPVKREAKLSRIVELVASLEDSFLKKVSASGITITDLLLLHDELSTTDRHFLNFATPHDVANLIAELADPQIEETVYDPACGSGQILMSCLQKASSAGRNVKLVSGIEKDYLPWVLSRINFIFCGYQAQELQLGDSINGSVDTSEEICYSLVVSNPPKAARDWCTNQEVLTGLEKLGFGGPPKSNGDYAFILHMISRIKPGTGRAVIVVPDGALYRQGIEGTIRSRLICANFVDAVISLPERSLYNMTTGVSLLILKSKKQEEEVLFIDARDCGSQYGGRAILHSEAISRITKIFRSRSIDDHSKLVTKEEISTNEFSLLPSRYIQESSIEEIFDFDAHNRNRKNLEKELRVVEEQLNKAFDELAGQLH
jgi:type I restriction enzyme M protein